MGDNDTERYGGLPYTAAGKTYLFAPIGLGFMERVIKATKDIADGKLGREESFEFMVKVINRSLMRNYPEMTPEFIRDEILELHNVGELYQLALEASGLKRNVLGKAPAEAQAA